MLGKPTEDLIGDIDLSEFITPKVTKGHTAVTSSDFKVKLPEGVVMENSVESTMCEYYHYKGMLMNKYEFLMRPIVVETQPNVNTRGVICAHKDGFKHFIPVNPGLLIETADEFPVKIKTLADEADEEVI